jgi:hypothetical protein
MDSLRRNPKRKVESEIMGIRKNTDFIGGMYTGMAKGKANRAAGIEPKVFDWDKAARLIAEYGYRSAEAGLAEDWSHTSGTIFDNGEPTEYGYAYLSSDWATPILVIDDEEIECSVGMESGWNASTHWPQSALELLNASRVDKKDRK